MMNTLRIPLRSLPIALAVLFLSACGSLNTTTQVRDSVYDLPNEGLTAQVGSGAATENAPAAPANSDDYYNEEESKQYSTEERSYYDMTYNDPYYYNYGRFGFGMGMSSYGSSYGMNYSYGSPGYNSPGWNDPYWNNSYQSGYGAYGSNPWYGSGWGMSYGYGYGSPYGYGGYGSCWSCPSYGYGYGSGWGYGPYYGYGGSCYGCYQPIIIWDGEGGSGTAYGHRPSISGGRPGMGGNTMAPSGNRMATYNPVGLQDPGGIREHQMPTTRIMRSPENPSSRPSTGGSQQQGRQDRPKQPTFEFQPNGGSMGGRPSDGGRTSPGRPDGGSRSIGNRR